MHRGLAPEFTVRTEKITFIAFLRGFIVSLMTVFATVLPQASIMHFGESNDRIFALSADSARAMGERYLMNSQPDSALLYFDIVVKRYNADSNPRRCRILVDAYIHEWSIYFGTYYDYYRSYESLYKAGEVCAASGMVDARVNLYLGGMYQTIYEQIGDNDVADKALAYYTKAYKEAIATHNDVVTDLVFMNISSLTSSIGNFAVTEKL